MDPPKSIPLPTGVSMGISSQPDPTTLASVDSALNLSADVQERKCSPVANSNSTKDNGDSSLHSFPDSSFNGGFSSCNLSPRAERSAFKPIVPKFVDPRSFSAAYFTANNTPAAVRINPRLTLNLPQTPVIPSLNSNETVDKPICSRDTQDLVKAVKIHMVPESSQPQQLASPSTFKPSTSARKNIDEFSLQKCLEGAQVIAQGKKEKKVENFAFDGTTVLCQVCGDRASGFHYGVHACEGCKGFFRRSIQQKIQYRPCSKNQQCSVLRINRNRCQYCRLKKCIAVGMSREAVRFGRVPKQEKEKILAEMQKASAQSQVNNLAVELEDEDKLVAAIITAHLETCEFTKDKILPLLTRYKTFGRQQAVSHMACPLNPNSNPSENGNGEHIWDDFSERYSPAIRGVVDFAKSIPGFHLLSQEDQVTLLKAGVFEVLLLRLSCLFDPDTKSLTLLNGAVYRRDAVLPPGHVGHGRFLVDSLFDFVDRLNCFCLNDADMAMFCAAVLISPDRPGIRNLELVERMSHTVQQALRKVLLMNHMNDPTLFQQLMLKIPDLRTLNTLHSEKLLAFKMDPHEKSQSIKGSSASDVSSRTRSPLSDSSSTESRNVSKLSVANADTTDWSTVCKASETSAGSPRMGTFLSALTQPARCPIEPAQINALNLCSSQFSPPSSTKVVTAAISIPPKANCLSPKYPKKETASYDSGKGTLSGKSASLSSADSLEGLSDHHHSDHSDTPSPKATSAAGHVVSHCHLPTTTTTVKGRSVGTNFLSSVSAADLQPNQTFTNSGALMPTLKRALEAPPITAALNSTNCPSPSSKPSGYGDVRQKHLAVASLLERRSTPANDVLMESFGSAAAINHLLAGGFHNNSAQQQQQQQRFPGVNSGGSSLLSVCPNVNFGGQQQQHQQQQNSISPYAAGQASSSWPGVIGGMGQFDFPGVSSFNPGFGGINIGGNFLGQQNRSAPTALQQPQLIRPTLITNAAAIDFPRMNNNSSVDATANSYASPNHSGFFPQPSMGVDLSSHNLAERSITPAHMKKSPSGRFINEGSPKRPHCADEADEQPLNLSKKPTVVRTTLIRSPTLVG